MSSRSQETLMQKARQSHLLTERRAANHNAAEKDLNKWIFDTIQLRKGSYVLELCSGTGAQTTHLLDHVGPTGHVVALDISAQALQTLASTVKTSTPLTLIESDMDNLPQALHDHDLQDTYFDVVFCAYGLYYSSNARALLDECKKRIKPEGALIIVGPYGPNNHPFFELLTACQVEIPPFVRYASEEFMYREVIPWSSQNFEKVALHTLVNPIRWESPDKVLHYWKNSIFFVEEKASSVLSQLEAHFQTQTAFVNEKWIMMVVMTHAR